MMTEHALNLPAHLPTHLPSGQHGPDKALPHDHPQTLNRREFLTYAWGAALAFGVAQGAAGVYLFMKPRFAAGEFGGLFDLGTAAILGSTTEPPQSYAEGKFWLVNTQEGPRALYMVCTHLGCLYKWNGSANRFECPCHNSMFSREGELINGPATRGLDQFVIQVIEEGAVVAQTEEDAASIRPPLISGAETQLAVDTGKRLLGKAHK